MTEPVWILDSVVVAVHDALIVEHGGMPGIRDSNLLESTLSRPKNLNAYDQNATIFDLAASYAFGIAKNHPFVDGNKRVALTLAATFLQINGYELDANEAETVLVFEDLASDKMDEQQLSKWFRANVREA